MVVQMIVVVPVKWDQLERRAGRRRAGMGEQSWQSKYV